LRIFPADESDAARVLRVAERAFGDPEGPVVAALVDALCRDPSAAPRLSLLAFHEDRAVGHILFTRARIAAPGEPPSAAILAPLAVIPECQSRGIGGGLIREGLRRLRESGVDLVFVLGHPGYYPRHGFEPAGVRGWDAPYPIPEKNADAWMVRALRPDVVGTLRGTVICADAMNRPEYWRE
jgi:putative acetyltransferase